jgi:hypothetical protein
LIATEKLVHPASGTLHFPVSLEEMLESTKGFKHEYLTKAKESGSPVETSGEAEVNKGVHNRGGSTESELVTTLIDNASSSSEEVVIVYENKMEVDDGDGDDDDDDDDDEEEEEEEEEDNDDDDANNRYENIVQASTEKGSKDIATSIKTSTVNKTHLVTENEELRQDGGHILHILEEGDDNESSPKRMKLDTTESGKKCCKLDTETLETGSQSQVKNSTAVPITGNGEEQQPVNGVAQDPKDVTEEEMLQAFVDVLSE